MTLVALTNFFISFLITAAEILIRIYNIIQIRILQAVSGIILPFFGVHKDVVITRFMLVNLSTE